MEYAVKAVENSGLAVRLMSFFLIANYVNIKSSLLFIDFLAV